MKLFLAFLLVLLLFPTTFPVVAQAATVMATIKPSSSQATMTLNRFLAQGQRVNAYHGPLISPSPASSASSPQNDHLADYSHLPSTAEPAHMQPLTHVLTSDLLATNTSGQGVTLRGSDNRLEVQLPAATFDLSQSHVISSKGTPVAATGALTLQITQLSGHAIGEINTLSSYHLQILDAQQHPLSGIRLRKPMSIIYHYQRAELQALDLNPDHLFLVWPTSPVNTQQKSQPAAPFVLPLQNNPHTQTLTAQTTVLNTIPFAVSGDPQIQSPPTPHLASVGGNAGQLTYSYPLQVPAGPAGFVPPLALNYSSSGPNERQSRTSAAGNVGDGWSLALGSVSVENDPASQGSASPGNWYFISGVANVSDRLVSDTTAGFYQTEHLSHLRIQQVTSSKTSQPCFNVWDTSGTYYEFGCTNDSLQYRTDVTGRTNYLWSLNRIIAPNEGPGTAYKVMLVTYLQDSVTTNGFTSIRDSAIKQITYGYGTATASIGTLAGTIDFAYKAPTANGSWASAYGTNYNCSGTPPVATTLRCDDPVTVGVMTTPTVVSTFSLQSITSYVGSDSSSSNKAYGYTFSYEDNPFSNNCFDPYTLLQMSCAGEHLLKGVIPIVYQNGTGHTLKGLSFGYTGNLQDVYYDSTHTSLNGTQQYTGQTWWRYLNTYRDLNTGVGGTATYATAFSNTHGTPTLMNGSTITDDRYDPLYCSIHANDSTTSNQCLGSYLHPEDRAWSQQVVTQTMTIGADSSALPLTTTTYHYKLAKTGTHSAGSPFCAPAGSESDCVGDNWIPVNSGVVDGDWQDYYHSEFHGFSEVDITSAAGDLTVDKYYSTKGWGTPNSDASNYNSGHLFEEDVYSGNQATDAALLQVTTNQFPGVGGATTNSCNGLLNPTYAPCEVMILSTRTTRYEGTGRGNTNAPWVQHDYTYDNYQAISGLGDFHQSPATGSYHNLQQEVISSSNAPTTTKKWTYFTNNQVVGTWVYYTVDKVAHSEVDDSGGHVWQCQDNTYDDGAAQHPAAGFLTIQKSYANCANINAPLPHYTAYDPYGNAVASVDPFAIGNSFLYANNGCIPSSPPSYQTDAWSTGRYTTCTAYDTSLAHVTSTTNALNQTSSTVYDPTQGGMPISKTDANGQTTSIVYTTDSNGNQIVQVSQPGEVGSYTSQSSTNSSCTTSSTLPCFEMDSNTSQYINAVTRTFYDALGRQIETRTPGPDAGHDTIAFTVYDDTHHSTFQSNPFRVLSGSSWVDPNGATDDSGAAPGGTATFKDALNRVVGTQDPLLGSVGEPGVSCPGLIGIWTTCTVYGLGSANGNTTTYATTTMLDPNNHKSTSFSDMLGRVRYSQEYSGTGIGALGTNVILQQQAQYNALDKPTSVIVTDLAPRSGQSVTQVTTTTSYDDLGRVVTQNDPDRGAHTYSYDLDGRIVKDVSGTRTIGTNYDLLGRVGCIQDAPVAPDIHGACSSGTNPFVINTYDADPSGVSWGSTNYAVGKLTQSFAINYFPGPDFAQGKVTENFQYDQRGRSVSQRLKLTATGGTLAFPNMPQYQEKISYNDANQPMTTQTTVGGSNGYTFSQSYDSTTGVPNGLSNTSAGTQSLVALNYNTQAQLASMLLKSTVGSSLTQVAYAYDANLRPTNATATWQSGSGQSGTIFAQGTSYDATGNRVSQITQQAAVPGQSNSGGTETQNFCYDEQNQLIWAGNGGTVPAAGNGTCGNQAFQSILGGNYANSYVYTHLGQLWQAPLNGSGTQEQYLYCNSAQPHQVTALSSVSSSPTCSSAGSPDYLAKYDNWGNITTRTVSGVAGTLSFDGLDHLVRWNASTSTTNNEEWYMYDGAGNRVLRRFLNASGTTIITYPFGLEEHTYNSSGTNQGDTYYYTVSGRLLGELSVVGSAQITRLFLTDELSSVVSSFTNVGGSAVISGNQTYGPYGNKRYSAGTMGTGKGFTGQYSDSNSGLDYYNARYYDPVAGRFVTADTVQGNAQGMDPYAYVGGNPETKSDPSGLHAVPGDGGCSDITCGGRVPLNLGTSSDTPMSPAAANQAAAEASANSTAPAVVPKPQGPPPWLAQIINALSSIPGIGGKVLWEAIDVIFNFSGIWHDIQTITDSNASWWAKIGAGIDLGVSVWNDINMLDGAGEAERAAQVGEEIAQTGEEDGARIVEGGCEGGLSFIATTKVATEVGEQAIGTLKVGEQVWAYNPTTKQMELQPILHVWINHDDDLVDLTITKTVQGKGSKPTSEVIHTNQKHPFLTVEMGFVPVGQITLGMHVVEADGQVGVITGWKLVAGVMTMYNLEVAQDHTFVVGMGQWVVHNCGQSTRGQMFNDAKRDAGIPTSLSPSKQGWVNKFSGGEPQRVYQFDVDGTQKYIIEHRFDPNGRGPHFHVADIKYAGQDLFQDGEKYLNLGKVDPNILAHYPEDFAGFI